MNLIAFAMSFLAFAEFPAGLLLIGEGESKLMYLAIGIGTLCAGCLMMTSHRRDYDYAVGGDRSDSFKRVELRKYRRRVATSAMITMIGCLITSWYWVTNRRVAAAVLLAILILLLIVATLALVDFFSVGLRHLVSRNKDAERALLEEIVRRHQESKDESE
ncbi:MAG: hypothetical protein AAFN77_15875 [Planctomycetota bacterium]